MSRRPDVVKTGDPGADPTDACSTDRSGDASADPSGGFSADWLALREPYDAAARDAAAAARLAAFLREGTPPDRSLPVVDLGGGTGSNLRWLAPRLGGRQHWRVLDVDARLLAALPTAMRRWADADGHRFSTSPAGSRIEGRGFHVEGRDLDPEGRKFDIEERNFDLIVQAERIDLAQPLQAQALSAGSLITASALLDLVSARWLAALLDRCIALRSPLLFALSYDGRIEWRPADPDDAMVAAAVNRHQLGDKGFGPALGPRAGGFAVRHLRAAGYHVIQTDSDWRFGPADAGIATALLEGWYAAALEDGTGASSDVGGRSSLDAEARTALNEQARTSPEAGTRTSQAGGADPIGFRARLAAWRQRRADAIAGGDFELRVGHIDLAAWPQTAYR